MLDLRYIITEIKIIQWSGWAKEQDGEHRGNNKDNNKQKMGGKFYW